MKNSSDIETSSLEIDGQEIAYNRRSGNENTLVFIHGNSAGKAAFNGQLSALKDTGYTLIAIDLPGHGDSSNSDRPEQDYNFPAFALLIKRFCDALAIKSPIIIGWSLGGHVVIEMAGRGFDLSGAVICGTPPIATGMSDFDSAFLPSEAMAVTLNPEPSEMETNIYLKGLYGSLDPIPQEFQKDAKRMDGAVRANMGAHWGSGEYGCHQKIIVAGWDKPLCVIHGTDDVFVSEEYLDSIIWRNLWRGKIQKIPGIGHAPFLEAPDTFNTLLREFADEVFS